VEENKNRRKFKHVEGNEKRKERKREAKSCETERR
jgi:hypothetical protein